MFVSLGDHESRQDAGSVPEIANTSFYLVQTDENDRTGSAACGDVSITQVIGGETLNDTEPPKTSENESFYFVDDKSVSVNAEREEPTLAATLEQPADTEAEAEQQVLDEQAEIDVEAPDEAPAIEVPPTPVTSLASLHDPDSLLTSVQLVIGELNLDILYAGC